VNTLIDISLIDISNTPSTVLFDMTLSRQEWQTLMLQTRSINLIGFGSLLRKSLYATQLEPIQTAEDSLLSELTSIDIEVGLVVESFVVDDLQDGDTGVMRFCGITMDSLSKWDTFILSCERSRFSFEMNGDVGEYLTHSFSSTIGVLGSHWGIRLGEIGDSLDIDGRQSYVYNDINVFSMDVALATGHSVERIIVGSLPSLLSASGNYTIEDLGFIPLPMTPVGVSTYTFRIYAFRAVFMAIDAFDLIML
jgi:hypothetical protein